MYFSFYFTYTLPTLKTIAAWTIIKLCLCHHAKLKEDRYIMTFRFMFVSLLTMGQNETAIDAVF